MNRRLISLARDGRLPLAVTILCALFAGLLTIVQARSLSLVVDQVMLGGAHLGGVSALLQAFGLVVLARSALTWLGEAASAALAARIKTDLRSRLMAKLYRLGPAFLGPERTGELTAAAVEGVESLDAYFSQYLPQLVLAALIPSGILLFAFPLDPLSGTVLLVTAPLIPVFMVLIGKAAQALTGRQWATLGALSAHFLDSLQGLTTLRLFGRSSEHAAAIDATSRRYTDVTLSVLRVTFLSALVLELIATLSTAVIAVEVGLRLLYARLAFRDAFFLLLLAPEFYLPLRMLGLRFHAGMAGSAAARRIFTLLDTPEPARPAAGERQAAARTAFKEICFENVGCAYVPGSRPALESINITLHAGEHVAVVGASGAGKSTLAALLLRFLEPTSGQILIDGQPLGGMAVQDWRSLVSWVPQSPFLFHDTLGGNLRLARPDATPAELDSAVRTACLDDFVHALPDGYDTPIREQGARLSGGQAQRLALARAFLKQAPLLILDEPTSSVDPIAEAQIEAATRKLMEGRTVLIIAHRLSTVRQADRILVLDQGRLVESGTHAELLSTGGVYAGLLGAAAETGGSHTGPDTDVQGEIELEDTGTAPPTQGAIRPVAVLGRLLAFLSSSRTMLLLSVLLGVLTVGSNIGLLATSAYLISSAALHPSIATLQVPIVGVRFFGLSRAVFRYLERLASHTVTFQLLGRLRGWFYRALEPLVPARLLHFRGGDLLGRVIADVGTLENFYVRTIAPPLVAVVISGGTALYLGRQDARMGLTYLSFALLVGLAVPLLTWQLNRSTGKRLVELRACLHADIVDGILGMPDVLVFDRQADHITRLREQDERYALIQRRVAAFSGLQNALVLLGTNAALLAVLVLAILSVRNAQLEGVMLAVLPLLVAASFEALSPLPQAALSLASSLKSARRLFEIVDIRPAVQDPPRLLPLQPGTQAAHLTVTALSFSHPGSTKNTLQDISFDLPQGRRLAIVGPSGSGKSTLAHLLLRFLDYSQGSIALDGHDLHAYAQEQVRTRMSACLQRSHFFNASLVENLRVGNPEASLEEVDRAVGMAGLSGFIQGLPDGYETQVGERGLRLSGGERQRLAIARALLRRAPILILDEPTANVDAATERDILAVILGKAGGLEPPARSLLLLTHRLVGMDRLDEILVLDGGRIVARGRHADLLAQGGLYLRLFELQERRLGQAG